MPRSYDFRNVIKDDYEKKRFDEVNKNKNIRERNRNQKSNSLPIITHIKPVHAGFDEKDLVKESHNKTRRMKSENMDHPNFNYF
jgi:hypothetical protein